MRAYFDNRTGIRAVLRSVLTSPEFTDARSRYQRYAWPVEFVARSLREVTVNGQPWTDFDRAKEWVRIAPPTDSRFVIEAKY